MSERANVYFSITGKDPNVQETLEKILQYHGFNIVTRPQEATIIVVNSQEAWEQIEKEVPQHAGIIVLSETSFLCKKHRMKLCPPKEGYYGGAALLNLIKKDLHSLTSHTEEDTCSNT